MKITPTFHENKYKRFLCSNCKYFVKELRLDEEKVEYSTCKKCGTGYRFDPPDKLLGEDGHKIITYGPNGGMFTGDLTNTDDLVS